MRAEELLAILLIAATVLIPIAYFRARAFVTKRRLTRCYRATNVAALRAVWRTVRRRAGPTGAKARLTLEEFFEGNEDPGSIAPNLRRAPALEDFYRTLIGLRAQPDVTAVLVEVDPREDQSQWPFAESVLVTTSRSPAEIHVLLMKLRPDSVDALQRPEAGLRVWWD